MTYTLNRLTHCTDLTLADWIRPRLAKPFSRLTSVVPGGFPAYARIVHGSWQIGGDQPRLWWRDVAASTGRTVHPLMQWHVITKGVDGRPDWDGDEAEEGQLDRPQLQALCEVLRRHTTAPDDCFHALWNGFGGWVGGSSMQVLTAQRSWWSRFLGRRRMPRRYSDEQVTTVRRPGPYLPDEVTNGPLLHHPLGRDYFLFAGPVEAADDFAMERSGSDFIDRQTPQLFWPGDRAWCVATEIDYDSTLVGGTRELIEEILADNDLEAYPVPPDGNLTFVGDQVNDPMGELARRRYS